MRSWIYPSPPESKAIEEQWKYFLTHRALLLLFIGFVPMSIICSIHLPIVSFNILLLLAITSALSIVYVIVYKVYKTPIIIFSLIFAICINFNLFISEDQSHFYDVVLMTLNVIIAMLILDFKLSFGVILLHMVGFTYHFWSYAPTKLKPLNDQVTSDMHATTYIFFISFTILLSLGWYYKTLQLKSSKQLNQTQIALQEQVEFSNQQNDEKTVMLKEIHHRVKNNLQIITSLLRLQARELENPEAISKFKDATNRVIAMSMIHEKMYQTDELSTMDLKEYLHDLSHDLVISYQSDFPVKIDIECGVESIGLKSVVPIALILNELISNTLKYAFDEYDNATISLSLMPYEDSKQCKMTYSDSGTWKAPNRKGSFGLDLIESLTMQLEGTVQITTFPKTVFEFIFAPLND